MNGQWFRQRVFKFIPDKVALQIEYFANFHRFFNSKAPQTYTEKIQWLKLYNRDPYYQTLVDKYDARKIVESKIGNQFLIPLIGGPWDSFDEIDFESLPDQFVLKCTHDSGGVVICKKKRDFDIENAKNLLNQSLRNNYYWQGREWPYKKLKPRIIAEKYMVDESRIELKDYKFFCFDGKCKFLFIATNRGIDTRFDFYDTKFQHMNLKNGHENSEKTIIKPCNFDKMIDVAEKLSEGLPHVRIDLYNINGNIYFGEYTLFHFSGLVPFVPDVWDKKFGEFLNLPVRKR